MNYESWRNKGKDYLQAYPSIGNFHVKVSLNYEL